MKPSDVMNMTGKMPEWQAWRDSVGRPQAEREALYRQACLVDLHFLEKYADKPGFAAAIRQVERRLASTRPT